MLNYLEVDEMFNNYEEDFNNYPGSCPDLSQVNPPTQFSFSRSMSYANESQYLQPFDENCYEYEFFDLPEESCFPHSKRRRVAANIRERNRMRHLNSAYEKLKLKLPDISPTKKLSKVEILKIATSYIKDLRELLEKEKKLHSLKKVTNAHGKIFISLPSSEKGKIYGYSLSYNSESKLFTRSNSRKLKTKLWKPECTITSEEYTIKNTDSEHSLETQYYCNAAVVCTSTIPNISVFMDKELNIQQQHIN